VQIVLDRRQFFTVVPPAAESAVDPTARPPAGDETGPVDELSAR
jgi:hypothetical protein